MRKLFLLFVAVLASGAPAFAQSSGEFTFDVPFQWTAPGDETTDGRTEIGANLSLDHLFASERGRLFYDMTVDSYGMDTALRTWLHNAGATMSFGSETRALDVGGSFFWRANEGDWSDAGFLGVNLLASYRLKPTAHLTITPSYALYIRQFGDQPALDQVEHFGAVRMIATFETRTTLAAAVSVGQKNYDGRELLVIVEPLPVDGTLHGGRGWRQGGLFVPTRTEMTGAPGTRAQWTWAARIAQSLDDRTGVWIEREERRTDGDLPPAIVWTPPLFYDDGVYDDPYVIDARTWRAGAKHIFASGHEVSGWVSYADREYAGLARADELTRAGLDVLIPLASGANASLDVVAGYSYFRNISSEILESYRAHRASAGVRITF